MVEPVAGVPLSGRFYHPGSARAVRGALRLDGNRWQVADAAGVILVTADCDQVDAVRPVADVPWRYGFPDGSLFECDSSAHPPDNSGPAHWLENHWLPVGLAVLSLPALIAVIVLLVLPAVSDLGARLVPRETLMTLDRQVLANIDEHLSRTFPGDSAEAARRRLDAVGREMPDSDRLRLEVRNLPAMGANAIALPGGTIVVTTQLLDTLPGDGELLAVLAHEQGHVVERHGVRNLLQSLGVAALLATVVGDVSGLAEMLLVSGPTLLQQMHYSREFEASADRYAIRQLQRQGLPGACLGSALAAIAGADEGSTGRGEADREERRLWWGVRDYLSTHPHTSDRIEAAGGSACPVRGGAGPGPG